MHITSTNDETTAPAAPIPSVEQINLEYRLSQSKASEAVQHAINCGLMLLQVKASLKHGEWLPWLKAQRETGQIDFSDETAKRYMRVASNRSRVTDLAPTSIRAALELLTEDKSDEAQSALDLETAKEREAADAKAKMIQEAVDRLNAEKAQLQSALALVEQRAEDFRAESIEKGKALKETDQLAKTAQSEAATLRRTLAAEAEKLANAKINELRQQLDNLAIDKAELDAKLKKLRKEQDEAVEIRAKQVIQAQQDEINRREAQLRSIEGRIEILNERLVKVDAQDRVVAHFDQCSREIRATLNTLGHQIQVALDDEDAPFLPAPFVPAFEKLAAELERGAQGVRGFMASIEIRHLEVATNE